MIVFVQSGNSATFYGHATVDGVVMLYRIHVVDGGKSETSSRSQLQADTPSPEHSRKEACKFNSTSATTGQSALERHSESAAAGRVAPHRTRPHRRG